MAETNYDLMRQHGVSRRSFLKFCSLTAASLGLGSAGAAEIQKALETKPRIPVIWLHGVECTCCSESFVRSCHPLIKDVVLSMISLDYHATLMAASGEACEKALEDTIKKYKGQYILCVEGNPCLDENCCMVAGEPFNAQLKRAAKDAMAVIGWGTCAAYGCINTAKPNPSKSVPITYFIKDKPVVMVPGCPPIPEVMTGVITYILTYGRLPPLDGQLRPKMFYGQRIHDKCYRRAHFDAGQFVEKFDDMGAKLGYCLYKVGCKGPVTYNACSSLRWNDALSWPVQSGHGCMACSEADFFDKGSFYSHEPTILPPSWGLGLYDSADKLGLGALGVMGAAVAVHLAASAVKQVRSKENNRVMGHEE